MIMYEHEILKMLSYFTLILFAFYIFIYKVNILVQ